MTNCKNCGAPLNANGNCDYCGTKYKRISDFDMRNANKIRLVLPDGQEVEMWGYVTDLKVTHGNTMSYCDCNGMLKRMGSKPIAEISFWGEVINEHC